MIFIYYFFAAIMVFFGYKSLRGGIEYLKFFKRELAKPESNYKPFCSIIAPCRGLDEDLRENLAALFKQDFPDYEVIFVVDDETDAAISVIEKLDGESKIIIAGKAVDSGQKVHNLREAVKHISNKSEVLVFVDSDAGVSENWLRDLIAPLENEKVGAATGYRWFISKSGGFSAEMRSVWNASIASALGENSEKNFCWGGSTAIRREVFEKLDIREKWKGTLSDDFMITRVLNDAKMPIYFVPQALTASVEDCSFGEMIEFTNRQMKITQIYAPHLWKASFIGAFMFSATFWAGIILLFWTSGWQFWLTAAFLFVIFILGFFKAFIRLKAVKLILTDYNKQLNRSFFYQTFLWFLSPLIYLYNSVAALASRKIIWRGIEYELKSPTDIVIKK
jgi:ceramide glucosyltransferase